MPDCKYIIFRGVGHRQQLLSRIKAVVQSEKLGIEIPLVKFEPGKGYEFYYGLAVNVDDIDATFPSENVKNIINQCQLGQPLRNPATGNGMFHEHSDIKKFLIGKIEVDRFNHEIEFEEETSMGDLDLSEIESADEVSHEDNGDKLDKLLWWCSAKEEGSLASFASTCEHLELLNEERSRPWVFMRRLSLLGYLESSNSRSMEWNTIPTTIVEKNVEGKGFFLAGRLTPSLISSIGNHNIERIKTGNAPTYTYIKDGCIKSIDTSKIGLVGNASRDIANILPDVDAWQASLKDDPDIDPAIYKLKILDGKNFVDTRVDNPDIGFYEAERQEGDAYKTHVFYDGIKWKTGNFYDLRFLHMSIHSDPIPLYVDSKQELWLNESSRWPMLYERPLVLASGMLPSLSVVDGKFLLSYGGISKELASTLCSRLRLQLQENRQDA